MKYVFRWVFPLWHRAIVWLFAAIAFTAEVLWSLDVAKARREPAQILAELEDPKVKQLTSFLLVIVLIIFTPLAILIIAAPSR